MARVTLKALYESPLDPELEDFLTQTAFGALNDEAVRLSRLSRVGVVAEFRIEGRSPEGRLRWSVAEEFGVEVLRRWDAESASRAIAAAAERFEEVARTVISKCLVNDVPHSLARSMVGSLRGGAPLKAMASVPLRHDDRRVIAASPLAHVRAALEDPFPFSVDLRHQLSGTSAQIEGSHLVISGASPRAAGLAAAAFVRAPRPVLLAQPSNPYWAYATIAILAGSFALSWLPLSAGAVVGLGVWTLAASALALLLGRRHWLLGRTAVGLVPVLIVVAFAIVYSIAGLSGHALSLQGEQLHLRDALLLSLSLASTVGLLDLSVSGWLRSIAYLEMLLVAGFLGTAAVVAVRALSARLDQTIQGLRLEQRDG